MSLPPLDWDLHYWLFSGFQTWKLTIHSPKDWTLHLDWNYTIQAFLGLQLADKYHGTSQPPCINVLFVFLHLICILSGSEILEKSEFQNVFQVTDASQVWEPLPYRPQDPYPRAGELWAPAPPVHLQEA